MIKEEIDSDVEFDKIDDNNGDENLYRELIVNNANKVENTYPKWSSGLSSVM